MKGFSDEQSLFASDSVFLIAGNGVDGLLVLNRDMMNEFSSYELLSILTEIMFCKRSLESISLPSGARVIHFTQRPLSPKHTLDPKHAISESHQNLGNVKSLFRSCQKYVLAFTSLEVNVAEIQHLTLFPLSPHPSPLYLI